MVQHEPPPAEPSSPPPVALPDPPDHQALPGHHAPPRLPQPPNREGPDQPPNGPDLGEATRPQLLPRAQRNPGHPPQNAPDPAAEMRRIDPPANPTDPASTMRTLTSLMDCIEWSIGAYHYPEWLKPSAASDLEIREQWPNGPGMHSTTAICPKMGVARLVTLNEASPCGGVVRYITCQSVWTYTLKHGESGLQTHDRVPAPAIDLLHTLSQMDPSADFETMQAELRLNILASLNPDTFDHGTYVKISNISRKYDINSQPFLIHADLRTTGPEVPTRSCLLCENPDCDGKGKISMNKLAQATTVRCTGNSGGPHRLSSDAIHYMFGKMGKKTRPTPRWQRGPAGPVTFEPSPGKIDHYACQPHTTPDNASPNPTTGPNPTLTICQANLDRGGRHIAGKIISYLEETHADLMCLQEVQNVAWAEDSLSALGWNLYRHGKIAILARRTTVETSTRVVDSKGRKCTHIWKSRKHASMAITLATKDGSVMVACAYVPSGVDRMAQAEKEQISDMHREIQTETMHHTHSIICMDSNETTTPNGRVRVSPDGEATSSGSPTPLGLSTMAWYAESKTNSREYMTKTGPDPRPYPTMDDMTHVQPSMDEAVVHSALDIIYTSNTLLPRLMTCTLDDRTRTWGTGAGRGKDRVSYHKIVRADWAWSDMWPNPDAPHTDLGAPPPLRGSTLKKGPAYSRMTDNNSAAISRDIDEALMARRNELKGIQKSSKLTDHQRLEAIYAIVHKTIMTTAYTRLGHAQPDQLDRPDARAALHAKWALLLEQVSGLLCVTLSDHFGEPPDPQTLNDLIEWFAEQGVALPSTKKDWHKWWAHRDSHRADVMYTQHELIITDEMAKKNPKRFFKLATGTLGVSNMDSLVTPEGIVTDDLSIEKTCTEFLRKIGGTEPEPDPVDPPSDEHCTDEDARPPLSSPSRPRSGPVAPDE